jgi:hypothetical protein
MIGAARKLGFKNSSPPVIQAARRSGLARRFSNPHCRNPPLPIKVFLRHAVRNLRSGLRAVCLLRVAPTQLCATWTQLVALMLLSVALPLFTQVLVTGQAGQFTPSGLPGALFQVPVLLLAAWALARLAGRAEQTLAALVLMLAASVIIDTLFWVFSLLALQLPWVDALYEQDVIVQYGPPLWLALTAAVAGVRLLQMPARRRVPGFAAAALLIALPLGTAWPDRLLWGPPYGDDDTDAAAWNSYQSAASEETLYLQPKLLDAELARLQPGRAGTIDLYFVGLAGFAAQDVFMREVEFVQRLFADRFGTASRSLLLINNAATVKQVPIASATALQAALRRVGAVMNRDEDILFLYLTSHGSEDHQLAIQFEPLQLRAIEPAMLRRMLDEAGIRRRVIVISACYSGGFVDALKTDETLVITASAADRASFGCTNEADFTYFGEAYFDAALRENPSFIAAFDLAKAAIARRERSEGYELSNPQIFIGAKIAAELAQFQRQLPAR